jgi:hypothetical protein
MQLGKMKSGGGGVVNILIKKKWHIDHIKYASPFHKEIRIANGILPFY